MENKEHAANLERAKQVLIRVIRELEGMQDARMMNLARKLKMVLLDLGWLPPQEEAAIKMEKVLDKVRKGIYAALRHIMADEIYNITRLLEEMESSLSENLKAVSSDLKSVLNRLTTVADAIDKGLSVEGKEEVPEDIKQEVRNIIASFRDSLEDLVGKVDKFGNFFADLWREWNDTCLILGGETGDEWDEEEGEEKSEREK